MALKNFTLGEDKFIIQLPEEFRGDLSIVEDDQHNLYIKKNSKYFPLTLINMENTRVANFEDTAIISKGNVKFLLALKQIKIL